MGVRGPNIAAYPPTVVLNSGASTPGVSIDQTSTTMSVQTATSNGYGTAVFASAGNADANTSTRFMQFKLQCEDRNRTIGFTLGDVANRFLVGITPTVAAWNIGANFQRDMDNASMTGSGLKLIDELEFVDQNNITIAGAGTDLTFYPIHAPVATNLIEPDPLGLRLDLNGSVIGWLNPSKHLADHNSSPNLRLIKLTTPWGVTQLHILAAFTPFSVNGAIQFAGVGGVDAYGANFVFAAGNDRWINMRNGVGGLIQDDNTSTFTTNPVQPAGAFLTSTLYGQAIRGVGGSAGEEGGGYDYNGSDAVNSAVNNTGLSTTMRDLIITGSGFRGVSAIEFRDSADRRFQWPLLRQTPVDPAAGTPAGITIDATGTTITISGTYIHNGNNTWAKQSQSINPGVGVLNLDRKIRLFAPSGAWNDTPLLDTNATNGL